MTVSEEGYLLRSTPSGENGLRIDFLTPKNGVLTVWQRESRKIKNTQGHADLFNQCELQIAPDREGRPRFLREIRIIRRFEGLGRKYETLRFCSRFAKLLLSHHFHEESPGRLYRHFGRALEAWNEPEKKAPEWVYLKLLYLFAGDEGLPVEQEWQPTLRVDLQDCLHHLLHQPAGPELPFPARAGELRENLERYLASTGDFRW
ncbi:MAG: recombination protein O N-terminal domain-containing protein [Opitutales bacterium]|nr:recombination protein O N-terminal domain-containing protein [Opitutales bacterium]